MRIMKISIASLLALLLVASFNVRAAGIEAVTVKKGVVMAASGGQMLPLTSNITLNAEIAVFTNATFQVGKGSPRELAEGQLLSSDGRLMSPNGKLEVVYDHITTDLGQVVMIKDGKRSPVTAVVKLEDGTSVSPDGWVTTPIGSRSRLLDGQMLRLSGSNIATQDTVTLINGEVVVQKDGARLKLERGRIMMMSDGTKVDGKGYLIFADGRKEKLVEGQIVTVEGAVSRR